MRIFFLLVVATVIIACGSDNAATTEMADPLFELLNPEDTGVDFVNDVRNTESHNIIQYLYYYNGGGVAIGDINGDELPDLFFSSNRLPNKLYINKGDLQFEEQTQEAGLRGAGNWKTGVSMADVNADGHLDIYVCQVGKYKRFSGRNELYINNGDGTFKEAAAQYGLDFQGFSQQAAWFDYDGDGDLDCFLLNHSVHSPENYQASEKVRTRRDSLSGDRLYRNDGGTFTDVSESAKIYGGRIGFGLGLVVSDFDNNGWPDVYVANDFHENDYLYLNQGDGQFKETLTASVGHTSQFSMGVDAADLNNDGYTDLLSLDMKPENESIKKQSVGPDPYNIYKHKLNFGYHYQYARNNLQINLGNTPGEGIRFSEIGNLAGVSATDWSWACLMADFDNDSRKDIFISNGIWTRPNDLDYLKYISDEEIQESASDVELIQQMPGGLVPNYAFRNMGNLEFEPIAENWGLDLMGCSNGAAYADLDADGDLDLVLNNLNLPASIYRNTSERRESAWLQIRLKGAPENPFAYGSRARLFVGGEMQLAELNPVRGWQSSVEPILHFGLPFGESPDSLQLIWPDGSMQTLNDVPLNQRIELSWEAGLRNYKSDSAPDALMQVASLPGLDYVHEENSFTDFNMEKLLPYELSEDGPCMAIADVNGDGLEDLFVGASKGALPQLFFQSTDGRFANSNSAAFAEDLLLEDVDAAFFDADGDSDLDLYVVSGGGEYTEGYAQLQDRLYINDGKGNLSRSTDRLPEWSRNGSCVVPLDFDKDGDLDLFVGSRSVPRAYGKIPESALFRNSGDGRFEEVAKEILPELQTLGMITDAVWLAEEEKLLITGHWMPLCIADFREPIPVLEKREELGWWNTLHVTDLDQNGKPDVVLGNLGWNTDLGKGNPNEPVSLFVEDFDENYSVDPIMAYYRDGKQVPFNWKDDLFGQIISLKKQFVDYRRYAVSSLDEVFEGRNLESAQTFEANYFSSAIWWDMDPQQDLQVLPDPIQWSTTEAITSKANLLFVAGNRDGFTPSLGRQDASPGWLLEVQKDRSLKLMMPGESGFALNGFVRGLKWIDINGVPTLLVLRNGNSLGAFTLDSANEVQQ
ncbi:MAG: VCBS repeat-containing protein [Bacteroidetes bacterium]|nr:VCBS repeat-containing protein [Bacteroidota bacterium]